MAENNIHSKIEYARVVALARERNVHYKVNGYLDSYKIEYKSGNIILTPSTTEFTNEDVIVSLTTDMNNIKYYYAHEGIENAKDWPVNEDGTFGTITVSRNNILYAFSADAPDVERSLQIDNIDKIDPTVSIEPIEDEDIAETQFTITINAEDRGGSGLSKYVITVTDASNPGYKPYTKTIYNPNETETITIDGRAKGTTYNCSVVAYDATAQGDNEGNESEIAEIQVTTKN